MQLLAPHGRRDVRALVYLADAVLERLALHLAHVALAQALQPEGEADAPRDARLAGSQHLISVEPGLRDVALHRTDVDALADLHVGRGQRLLGVDRLGLHRDPGARQRVLDVRVRRAVEDRRDRPPAERRRRPAEVRLQHLADVHARRHADRVEHDLDVATVVQVRHVLDRHDPGHHALVAVAAGHLVALGDLALLGDRDAHHHVHVRRQLVVVARAGRPSRRSPCRARRAARAARCPSPRAPSRRRSRAAASPPASARSRPSA